MQDTVGEAKKSRVTFSSVPLQWSCQCWSTSKNLPTTALHGYGMQFRWHVGAIDDRDGEKARGRERERQRDRVKEIRACSAVNNDDVLFTDIIIIIMSCRQHGYPWPSLATSSYRSSPLAGLQDYIPYPHIAAVCMFELVVLLLLGHMWGSIGVHHLWARPCFSSSVLDVWFV